MLSVPAAVIATEPSAAMVNVAVPVMNPEPTAAFRATVTVPEIEPDTLVTEPSVTARRVPRINRLPLTAAVQFSASV